MYGFGWGPILVMVIYDVFYSHFSAVPMFKISVRKLPASLGRFFLTSSLASMGLWTMGLPDLMSS